uniref:Uncharacterized protein n=1 Tax=Kuenenia stuttgartiensis TaxID=174633 RepID=Q1PX15_KUEST|nr:unknown protein [Candidatus Kuenenia stuttgartiensis]
MCRGWTGFLHRFNYPLYYENKFDPLSHAPQTGQMDNFILILRQAFSTLMGKQH